MADIPNPKWYDEGTVALTQGSPTVTGTGTFWVSAGVQAGDIFLDADKKIYEITAVNDSTSLTLGNNYTGATGSGKGYSIIRVFNSTMNATLANRVSILLSEFEQRYDLDMQTIMGKSAYDIAKDEGYTGTQSEWIESLNAYGVAKANGFTGTQAEWLDSLNAYGVAVKNGFTGTLAEWLESLKAAGEWSKLDARTNVFVKESNLQSAAFHNSIAGFRNLGTTITDKQRAAIKAFDCSNLYIGDYWTLNGHKYWIAKFYEATMGWTGKIMMLSDTLYQAHMNETDTNEGGYGNSWLHNTGLAQAEEILTADWGNLLGTFQDYIYGRSRDTMKCMVPSYWMISGNAYESQPQFMYSFYHNIQLPIFLYEGQNKVLWNEVQAFWLQEQVGTTMFLNWGTNGRGSGSLASTSLGVRVIFFIA